MFMSIQCLVLFLLLYSSSFAQSLQIVSTSLYNIRNKKILSLPCLGTTFLKKSVLFLCSPVHIVHPPPPSCLELRPENSLKRRRHGLRDYYFDGWEEIIYVVSTFFIQKNYIVFWYYSPAYLLVSMLTLHCYNGFCQHAKYYPIRQ